MARFLELCLDTTRDHSPIGEFWAAVIGGTTKVHQPGYPANVVGATEQQGISVCVVPEPKTVKNRIHLDIYTRAIADLRFAAEHLADRPDVFYHLALALNADHKPADALKATERALKLAPEYADARNLSTQLRR